MNAMKKRNLLEKIKTVINNFGQIIEGIINSILGNKSWYRSTLE